MGLAFIAFSGVVLMEAPAKFLNATPLISSDSVTAGDRCTFAGDPENRHLCYADLIFRKA